MVKTYPSIDPVVAPPILLNVIFVFTSVAMTLRSQRSIYGHCLGHGSGTCMFKAARENCTISYEVNKCRKHMLLNDILQLVVLLDNYTTLCAMCKNHLLAMCYVLKYGLCYVLCKTP